MHTPDLTAELIHALIPADYPEHNQLRYFFNQLLKIRSPDSDESSQVYFPPTNWPDCNLNQEQLSELFNKIHQQKKLRTWPVPAYLSSIHLAIDPQLSIHWAGLNAHILLALANMQDRQDLIDHLSARFRMAATNQKHTWLWAQLPSLEPTWQATEKALENIEARMEAEYTRSLESYQQSLPGSELQATPNKRAFTDYWKRLFPYPDTAFRRMGEIRLAYITAIQHRPKIQRSLSTPPLDQSSHTEAHERAARRHPATKQSASSISRLEFAPEKIHAGFSSEEQRYDRKSSYLAESLSPAPKLVSDSPAAQIFSTRLESTHISRRGFAFVTDPLSLPLEAIQRIYQTLNHELQASSNPTSAWLLLALLTGESIQEHIENPAKLQSQLHWSKPMQAWLWIIKLDLPPLAHQSLKPLKLNRSDKLGLPLPCHLVDLLRKNPVQGVQLDQIKRRVSDLGQQISVALLSSSRISSALHQVIDRELGQPLLADAICGVSPKHSPALFYSSLSWQGVHHIYSQAIQLLAGPDSQSTQYLQVAFEPDFSGSQTAISLPAARDFINQLYAQTNRKDLTLADRHNAYTLWLWHVTLLLTSIRTVDHAPGTLNMIDLKRGLLWVADKENRGVSSGRLVPICKFLNQAIRGYLQHLEEVDTRLGLIHPEIQVQLRGIFCQPDQPERPLLNFMSDHQLEPITPDLVKKQVAHLAPLPLNWTRHLGRGYLDYRLPTYLVDALLGHEAPDQEAANPFSSLSLLEIRRAGFVYDQMAEDLGLALPKTWRV